MRDKTYSRESYCARTTLFEPFFVSESQLRVRIHKFSGQLRCRVSVSRDAGKVFYPKRNASSGRLVKLSDEDAEREQVFITLYSPRIVTIRSLEYVTAKLFC